jgi:hypothetical protein
MSPLDKKKVYKLKVFIAVYGPGNIYYKGVSLQQEEISLKKVREFNKTAHC